MTESNSDFFSLATSLGMSADQMRLQMLMMPHAARRQAAAFSEKTRFVHYTSAETAVSIIRNKEIWLRKVACMNDLSEVHYGNDRLYRACSPEKFRDRLRKVLDSVGDGVVAGFEELWGGWQQHLFSDTYTFCLSEHENSEDILGRLSMWRAYGKNCGVALVVNSQFSSTASPNFGAFTSPVAYFSDDEFMHAFEELLENMEHNVDFLKSIPRENFVGMLFNVFRYAALATKHPAFREEREWRIIHSPRMDDSKYIVRDVAVIGGVPQQICKIPLKDVPEVGLVGAEIPSLVDRIIIGPTEHAFTTWEAFVELLMSVGVPEPEKRVIVSRVPLRNS